MTTTSQQQQQQQQLLYAAYPERPKLFALVYQDQLMAARAIRTIGTDGFALLIKIVLTEDRLWYRRPPDFWNSELAADLGWSEDKLDRVRKKLCAMGLLHYDREHSREAGVYWVLVPAWMAPPEVTRDADGSPAPVRGIMREDVRGIMREDMRNLPKALIPIPNPTPTPPPPETPTAASAWAAVEQEMARLGIGETAKPLECLQSHQVSPDLALGVLRFASESGAWEGGKIRRRLINLWPGQDPRNPKLWMRPDHPERLPRSAAPASAADVAAVTQREQDRRLRQLLIDFEAEVKGRTIPEIVALYDMPEPLQQRLSSYQRWEQIRSDTLQLAVLEIVQRHTMAGVN